MATAAERYFNPQTQPATRMAPRTREERQVIDDAGALTELLDASDEEIRAAAGIESEQAGHSGTANGPSSDPHRSSDAAAAEQTRAAAGSR